jgi:pSer/pThr/pTyr-binding forkhead associated (FHA) protein
MQQCSNCGHQNRAGVVFCENCGASLIGKVPLDTRSLEGSSAAEKAKAGLDASVLTDVKIQGISIFREGDVLQLEVESGPEPIQFKPSAETIFGRRDPATGAMPDVDLTPFAGYRMGVSRRHAAIRLGENNTLDIWDLGSSNGTYLNGQRLGAHRPYRLHDGDELRLGQMMIRVFFKSGEKLAKAPEAAEAVQPQPEAEEAGVAETKAEAPVTAALEASRAKVESAEAPAPEPPAAKPEAKEASTAEKPEVAVEKKAEEGAVAPQAQPAAPAPEPSAAKPEATQAPAPEKPEVAAQQEVKETTPPAPAAETAGSSEEPPKAAAAPEQPEAPKAEASASAQAPPADAKPPAASSETSAEKKPETPASETKGDQESPSKPESSSE